MRTLSRFLFGVFSLLLVGLLAPIAHADSVVYTFTGTSADGLPVGFQLTSSASLAGTSAGFLTDQLSTCTNCPISPAAVAVTFATFPPSGSGSSSPTGGLPDFLPIVSILGFTDVNGVTTGYVFSSGAFGAPGTYNTPNLAQGPGSLAGYVVQGYLSPFGTGELTVSVVTPEPSSLLLFGCGLATLLAVSRRKSLRSR